MNFQSRKPLPPILKFLVWVVVLMAISLSLRLLYQSESIVKQPLRADSGKYARLAYNLHFHGSYSVDATSRAAPLSRSDIAPGYPLFLSLLIEREAPRFVDKVCKIQAVMGALVVVATFTTAFFLIPLPWAVAAGLFTALSPHLIVISDHVLTENLFIFTTMLGLMCVVIAQKFKIGWLFFLAGLLLAYAAYVRYIGLATFIAVACGVCIWAITGPKAQLIKNSLSCLFLLMAFAIIKIGFTYLTAVTVTNSAYAVEPSELHGKIHSPLHYAKSVFIPTEFAMNNETHVNIAKKNDNWRNKTKVPFSEQPWKYVKWNLYTRFKILWSFDSAYSGDVYIYPMLRKGFHETQTLEKVYRLMRLMHWPLLFLALFGFFLASKQALGKVITGLHGKADAIALAFLSQIAGLTLVSAWLPRYGIPVRPLSYILAAVALSFMYSKACELRDSTTDIV